MRDFSEELADVARRVSDAHAYLKIDDARARHAELEQQVAKLDKNKTYLVHCAVGGRSARACKKMEKMGFSKLYNLEGGMGAWEKAGKPVQK